MARWKQAWCGSLLVLLGAWSTGCCCIDRPYYPGAGLAGDCGDGCCVSPFERLGNRLTCGSGCGGVYWGEWISDPPDRCDPCNDHGDWVGPQCCPPPLLSCLFGGLFSLGGRCCGSEVADGGGCSSCGTEGHSTMHGYHGMEEYVVPPGESIPRGEPVPAKPAPKQIEPPAARLQGPTTHTPAQRPSPSRYTAPPSGPPSAIHSHPVRPAGGTTPARRRAI